MLELSEIEPPARARSIAEADQICVSHRGGERSLLAALAASSVLAAAKLRRAGWWKEDPSEIESDGITRPCYQRGGNSQSQSTVSEERDWWRGPGPDMLCAILRKEFGGRWSRAMLVERAKWYSEKG